MLTQSWHGHSAGAVWQHYYIIVVAMVQVSHTMPILLGFIVIFFHAYIILLTGELVGDFASVRCLHV